ncbi:MAG: hypothetical protein BWK73_37810 [Thiothrix lacustris]|uniref:Uncharacterized protein n=1 Tax=Thiothrix lacustris TaxID=525917 RepID=A0A1Y1QEU9_9GAMM|nr:MAG: hypothetical protein BWK73_37810 [Thiothrix lacustris]
MNPTITTPEMQAKQTLDVYRKLYAEQNALVTELKDLYALVEVSRQAVNHVNADETDAAANVLLSASNRLYDLCEQEKARASALELLAYPELVDEVQS